MKIIIHNQEQLRTCLEYIKQNFAIGMFIDFDYFVKSKTQKQLGYVFDCIFGSITKQKDVDLTTVKESLYNAVSAFDHKFMLEYTDLFGKMARRAIRISDKEMTVDMMSLWISHCLYIVDNYEQFADVRFHPSVRYSWIYKITKEDLRNINRNVPDRDPEYLSRVRKESCACCGIANKSEAHHMRINSLGGVGIKPSDAYTLPLCEDCHREIAHMQGNAELLKRFEWITKHMSIDEFMLIKYNRYRNDYN